MLKGKLQVTIKDGVLVKAVEIKTDDDSQSYIDYIVPDGVTKIGIGAFWNCVSLRSIIIPKHVAEIDLSAFHGCCNLESVTIPDTIIIRPYIASTSGNWLMFTFEKCHKLKDININISDLATYLTTDWEWRNIKTFGIYQTGWRGRHMLVNGEKITELVIPDGITRIGDNALFGYEELTSIKLPEGVTAIGANAFSHRITGSAMLALPLVLVQGLVGGGGGFLRNCRLLGFFLLLFGRQSQTLLAVLGHQRLFGSRGYGFCRSRLWSSWLHRRSRLCHSHILYIHAKHNLKTFLGRRGRWIQHQKIQ